MRDQVVALWPEAKAQTVVGFGFAVPLLRPYLKEARRVIGLMPGPQGVMHWPVGERNISVLCEETLWPLETGSVDKLIVLHGLDTSEHPAALLEECYRVLGPGGRGMFIVPNRVSPWARKDGTPFCIRGLTLPVSWEPAALSRLFAGTACHGIVPTTARHAVLA